MTSEVRSGIDWFELHGTVDFGEGLTAALPRLLDALRQGNSTVWFQQLGPGLYWDSGSPHCPHTRPSGKLFCPALPEPEWVRAPCTARPLELM
jgi:hypothetical protein